MFRRGSAALAALLLCGAASAQHRDANFASTEISPGEVWWCTNATDHRGPCFRSRDRCDGYRGNREDRGDQMTECRSQRNAFCMTYFLNDDDDTSFSCYSTNAGCGFVRRMYFTENRLADRFPSLYSNRSVISACHAVGPRVLVPVESHADAAPTPTPDPVPVSTATEAPAADAGSSTLPYHPDRVTVATAVRAALADVRQCLPSGLYRVNMGFVSNGDLRDVRVDSPNARACVERTVLHRDPPIMLPPFQAASFHVEFELRGP